MLLLVESLPPGDFLALFVKSTFICLLGVSLGSELSFLPAVARHRIALGTVLCLAVLPLLSWTMFTWELPILQRETGGGESDLHSLAAVLLAIYLVVALLLLAKLCVDLISTALLSGRAIPAGTASQLLPSLLHPRGDVRVKTSREIRTPFTWGWLKPSVLLPQEASDWAAEDLSMVLQHELTHIQRADWLAHLLARCVHALYWPLPGTRILMRQLSLSMEQACDDRVLATGVPAPSYAAMLLRQATGVKVPATVSLGQSSELGIRIRNLVVEIVDHSVLGTGTVATFTATFFTCVVITMPLATMQLGSRPELPELVWGSAKPKPKSIEPTVPTESMQIDESALAALRPGPEHPVRPSTVEKPPKFKGQEKPSIPPP